ncbi:MAG: BatA domain-containing protein [Candidatus Bipolaricaulaceae bacterium]
MQLGFPAGLGFLAALAPVLLLHFWRRRVQRQPVSALFLWEQLPQAPLSRFQRLWPRRDLLLWLQLAAVLALATALADPAVMRSHRAGSVAIILDGSASMSTEGLAEAARDTARRWVANSAGPWTVVRWSDPPLLLAGLTSARAEALAAVAAFQPTLGGRPPLGEALALLAGTQTQVVLITDQPPAAADGVELVTLLPPPNYAITAFSVRSQPDGSGYQAFVRVRNDSPQYVDLSLRVRAGTGQYMKSLLLPPRGEETFSMPYLGPVGQGFVAELLPDDAFPWDNARYLTLGAAPLRVRWLGQEDRYVWAALSAAREMVRATQPPWDLTVAVRTRLQEAPSGPLLLVEAACPEAPMGELEPAGSWVATADLLLSHVWPEDWVAENVRPVRLPPGAVVALRAGELPAAARWTAPQGLRVLLSVELARSNLPLTVDFPVFLANALRWLVPEQLRDGYLVGEAVPLQAGAGVEGGGQTTAAGWVPSAPGLYTVQLDGEERQVAVNVPPAESVRQPLTRAEPTGGVVAARSPWSVTPWLALVALLVLAGEGALAIRRGC